MNSNNTNYTVQLYAESYTEPNNITNAFLRKEFGFELVMDGDFEKTRKILTIQQLHALHRSIGAALQAWDAVVLGDGVAGCYLRLVHGDQP